MAVIGSIIDKESEKEFGAWLNSIEFVDEEGNVIEYKKLPEDISDDPEGDRG